MTAYRCCGSSSAILSYSADHPCPDGILRLLIGWLLSCLSARLQPFPLSGILGQFSFFFSACRNAVSSLDNVSTSCLDGVMVYEFVSAAVGLLCSSVVGSSSLLLARLICPLPLYSCFLSSLGLSGTYPSQSTTLIGSSHKSLSSLLLAPPVRMAPTALIGWLFLPSLNSLYAALGFPL
jgi:hypothetical protein